MTDTPPAPMPTHVNGQEVIADEPAPSPLSRPGQKPILLKKVRLLLLADGSTVYACAECGKYTGAHPTNVIAHIRAHRRTDAAATPAPTAVATPNPPSSDGTDPATAATAALRELIAERDIWRSRAESAARDLTELRAAIQRPAAPDHRVPPNIVAHAKERLRILGSLTRTELRAMTGLNTAGLDALAEILITEGVAKPTRRPGDRGAASAMLSWIG